MLNGWQTRELARALVAALPLAPHEPERRSAWLEGLIDGYFDRPYRRIVSQTDPIFPIPSDDPYRKGYFVGKFSRTCGN